MTRLTSVLVTTEDLSTFSSSFSRADLRHYRNFNKEMNNETKPDSMSSFQEIDNKQLISMDYSPDDQKQVEEQEKVAPEVFQFSNPSSSTGESPLDGCQRRLVVRMANCSVVTMEDEKFNRILRFCFVLILVVSLSTTFIYLEVIQSWYFVIQEFGFIWLTIFGFALLVVLLRKKRIQILPSAEKEVPVLDITQTL